MSQKIVGKFSFLFASVTLWSFCLFLSISIVGLQGPTRAFADQREEEKIQEQDIYYQDIDKLNEERNQKLGKIESEYTQELDKIEDEYQRDISENENLSKAQNKFQEKRDELKRKVDEKKQKVSEWYEEKSAEVSGRKSGGY